MLRAYRYRSINCLSFTFVWERKKRTTKRINCISVIILNFVREKPSHGHFFYFRGNCVREKPSHGHFFYFRGNFVREWLTHAYLSLFHNKYKQLSNFKFL